jgi:hypothetical protein
VHACWATRRIRPFPIATDRAAWATRAITRAQANTAISPTKPQTAGSATANVYQWTGAFRPGAPGNGRTAGSATANVYQSAHVNTAGSTTATPQRWGLGRAALDATGLCPRASLGSRAARQVGWGAGVATGAVIGWLWHGPDRYGHGLGRHAHADERAASTVTWGTTAPPPALAATRGVLPGPRGRAVCVPVAPLSTHARGEARRRHARGLG